MAKNTRKENGRMPEDWIPTLLQMQGEVDEVRALIGNAIPSEASEESDLVHQWYFADRAIAALAAAHRGLPDLDLQPLIHCVSHYMAFYRPGGESVEDEEAGLFHDVAVYLSQRRSRPT